MSSIFELPTDLKQVLGSTEQLAQMKYEQIPATREIASGAFSNGAISFKFSMSGQKHWVPNKSYLRTRVKLTKVGGVQLESKDGVAPTMDMTACLFQSAEFRMGDKTISRISDNLSQIDALDTRLDKSKSWLDGAGASSNFWQKDFQERQNDVVSNPSNNSSITTERTQLGYVGGNTVAITADTGVLTFVSASVPDVSTVWAVGDEIEISAGGVVGTVRYRISALTGLLTLQLNNLKGVALPAADVPFRRIRSFNEDARKVKQFETVWQPPLSIFKIGKALPSGKYELVLNPQTAQNLQKAVVESVGSDKLPADYVFEILSMYLYIETVNGPRGDNLQYLLDLSQTRCQSDTITTNSLVQKQFDVSPSTQGLTVCYQDSRAGLNTLVSSTKFRSYNLALTAPIETKLDRFFLQYAGQNYPQIDSDEVKNDAEQKDWTTQRYVESQLYSGAWFDTGSAESSDDYKTRGFYMHFKTPRDSTDRSTRVSVNSQFSQAVVAGDLDNLKILLFDHSKQLCRVTVEEGQITNLQIEDA